MRQMPRTHGAGTETSEGYIAHREVFADCGIVLAPVKLIRSGEKIATTTSDGGYLFPIPLRRDGRLVFALPGGGEFLA